MDILAQYPFVVRNFGGGNYGHPVAVARLASGLNEASIRSVGSSIQYTDANGDLVEIPRDKALLDAARHEVRAMEAALGWPAKAPEAYDVNTGEVWQWLVIKHMRGLVDLPTQRWSNNA